MADTVAVVTVDEALEYLGFDYADAVITAQVSRAITTADAFLKGAIGTNYPSNDPRAKELALIVVADLYDNRGLNEKASPTVRRLVQDFALQLRLDLRGDT